LNYRLAGIGIFLFGFSGMTLEIILLYQFQMRYGFLYSEIGLLIAGFMLGLAVGAGISDGIHRFCSPEIKIYARWVLPGLLIVLFIATMVTLKQATLNYIQVISLIVSTGLLTGLYFPMACHLLSSQGLQEEIVASRMNRWDHTGAILGAGLTGTVLLPVLGIEALLFGMIFLTLVFITLSAITGNLRKL